VVGRVATGPRAGRAVQRAGRDRYPAAMTSTGPLHADLAGFDLQAAVAVPAGDRARLEHLWRYVLRPPTGRDAPRTSCTTDRRVCSSRVPAASRRTRRGAARRDSIALGRSPAPIADNTPTCSLLGSWAGAIPGAEEGHGIMLSCPADDAPGTAYRHAPIARTTPRPPPRPLSPMSGPNTCRGPRYQSGRPPSTCWPAPTAADDYASWRRLKSGRCSRRFCGTCGYPSIPWFRHRQGRRSGCRVSTAPPMGALPERAGRGAPGGGRHAPSGVPFGPPAVARAGPRGCARGLTGALCAPYSGSPRGCCSSRCGCRAPSEEGCSFNQML